MRWCTSHLAESSVSQASSWLKSSLQVWASGWVAPHSGQVFMGYNLAQSVLWRARRLLSAIVP